MTPTRPTVPLLLVGLAFVAGCSGGQGGGSPGPAAAAVATPVAAPPRPSGEEGLRDCGAPLPGHPTAGERRAFVQEVSGLATEAERRHGTPAAAVAAIAIQESGYGWTPLARETNNLMAWKWTSTEAAGGREAWVLECPAQGTTDRFVRFRDRAEAVDFVARQLATSDNYRADTERYRRERDGEADAAEAVDRWVDGVADPYSSQPDAWGQAIRRVMNDPLDPSDRRSPEGGLYRLSEGVRPPQG